MVEGAGEQGAERDDAAVVSHESEALPASQAPDLPDQCGWVEAQPGVWVEAGNGVWDEHDWSGVPVRSRSSVDADPGEPPPGWEESRDGWIDDVPEPALGPVSWLDSLAPSSHLMAELENLPPEVVDADYDSVEMVAHWARLGAYCAAKQREAAAALARRELMAGGLADLEHLDITVSQPNIAGDELAIRLGIGKQAATRMMNAGRAMAGVAIPTAEALEAGAIDAVKADIISLGVEDLPPDAALEVQELVLAKAPYVPSGSVRRELAVARAKVQPADFEERCADAARARRVDRPRVLPDGMASIYAILPAPEANQVYRAVDAAARSAKSAGDGRTLDQLRADALAHMGATAIDTGWIGPCPCTQAPAVAPVAPQHDRDRPPDAGPGDHGAPPGMDPPDAAAWTAAGAGVCPPAGARMRVGQIGGKSAHIRVVVPLTSLMGGHDGPAADLTEAADAPAHLEGYGPIPASTARALAAGSTWARMVTDPVDRSVLELTTDKYKPPAAMAALVRARQPECIQPSCAVPADSCDLNHRIPWPAGITTARQLDPGCRRDHLLITHAGWSYTTHADGSRTWATPTGHVYTEHRDGTLTMHRRSGSNGRENGSSTGTGTRDSDNDPPPF